MSEKELRTYAKLNVLKRHYSPTAAEALYEYINGFMPYVQNFKNMSCYFANNGNQLLLTIDCPIYVLPPTTSSVPPPAQGTVHPLRVELVFLPSFPSDPPTVRLLPGSFRYGNVTEWCLRPVSSTISSDGTIRLDRLSLLEQATPPYTFLEILLALTEQFEAEFPFIPAGGQETSQIQPGGAAATAPDYPRVSAADVIDHTSEISATAPVTQVAAVSELPLATPVDVAREGTVQRACDAVASHLLLKAEAYLDTRARALEYLKTLNKASSDLVNTLSTLKSCRDELLKYSPADGRVESLIAALEHLPNSLEEHSNCIVPADDVQAQALELLGDIHALDDVLKLLERSLRQGQITCEEYVRRVSDVGRHQFEARFLFGRLAAAINVPQASAVPPSSNIAQAASAQEETPALSDAVELLRNEFPEVESQVVLAVLDATAMNLSDARVQLRAMMS